MEYKIRVYGKRDTFGRRYFAWHPHDIGGYYNLEAMLNLRNMKVKDAILIIMKKEDE